MHPPEYENLIATLFSLRGNPLSKVWILHDVNGFLTFGPARNVKPQQAVFLRIAERMIQKGLTPKQWHALGDSLTIFYKGQIPCLKPQQP